MSQTVCIVGVTQIPCAIIHLCLFCCCLFVVVFCRTQLAMLNSCRNFTVSCNLTASQLQCKVDECFAPVVPGTSYCQINNDKELKECEKKSLRYSTLCGMNILYIVHYSKLPFYTSILRTLYFLCSCMYSMYSAKKRQGIELCKVETECSHPNLS